MTNRNLEKQMNWVISNPEMVNIIGREYQYGNSIKDIVNNHGGEFDRHKVYAALDWLDIPRRNKPNDNAETLSRLVNKAKSDRRGETLW